MENKVNHMQAINFYHLFLSFYLVVKRLMITRNLVVKIQNLVNHESQPIKSNHEKNY